MFSSCKTETAPIRHLTPHSLPQTLTPSRLLSVSMHLTTLGTSYKWITQYLPGLFHEHNDLKIHPGCSLCQGFLLFQKGQYSVVQWFSDTCVCKLPVQGGCSPRGSERLDRLCPRPLRPPLPSPPPRLERTARLPVLPAEKDTQQFCPYRQNRRHTEKFPKWKAARGGGGVSVFLRACCTAKAWTAVTGLCPGPSPSSGPHLQPGTWGDCPGIWRWNMGFGATQIGVGSFSVGSPALASILGSTAPVGSWFLLPE